MAIQTGELRNMAHNVADIRYNVEKANRTDGRVQNLACYIDKGLLRLVHRRMDRNKASGIDKVTKLALKTELTSQTHPGECIFRRMEARK